MATTTTGKRRDWDKKEPEWAKELGKGQTLIEPPELLYELDRRGIPYKVEDGQFKYRDDHGSITDGMVASLKAQKDAVISLARAHVPHVCAWCHSEIRGFRIVFYAQEEGRKYAFHETCHRQRQAHFAGSLPTPEVLVEEPGYKVLVEDSGKCCFCNKAAAVFPFEAPNVCPECWEEGGYAEDDSEGDGTAQEADA